MNDTVIDKAKALLEIDEATFEEKKVALTIYLEMIEDELEEALGEVIAKTVKESLKIKMLVEKYNRQGTEVLQTYNYSGVSETFLSGYSQTIVDSIESYKRQKRKVRFI